MPKRKARTPAEPEAQRCMRLLEVINFESLRARIEAPELLPEYKRFITLKAALGDTDATKLSPPAEIDAIWHSHILDTKHYRTMCEIIGRGFIDHNPDGGADENARASRRATTLAEYQKAFGAAPDVWTGMRPLLAPRGVPQQQGQRSPPGTQARRPRTRAQNGPDRIKVKIFAQDGSETFYILRTTTPLQRLMQAFCDRQGIAMDSVRFSFDGSTIRVNQTPVELSMEDGDVIDVWVNQIGC